MSTARQNSAALRGTRSTVSVPPTSSPRPVGPVGTAIGLTRPTTPATPAPPADNLVMRNAPRATQAPSSGGGGGGGGSRNVPSVDAPPPATGSPQPLDFRDSSYNSQIAAIERALRDFETGAATRGQRYQEDFTTGLGRLGFRPAPQPMMASRSMEGAEGADPGVSVGPMQGSFDIEGEVDRTSAAARGTRGMRDEFAGRGTLRSSDFAKSFDDFQNRLQQQLTGMETGRTRFSEDLATELAQFQTRTQEQRQAAEAAAQNRALMRSLSQMGF